MTVEIEKQDSTLRSELSTKEIDVSFWKKLPVVKNPLLPEFTFKMLFIFG